MTDIVEVVSNYIITYKCLPLINYVSAAVDILQYLKEGLEATMHVQEISTFAQVIFDSCISLTQDPLKSTSTPSPVIVASVFFTKIHLLK